MNTASITESDILEKVVTPMSGSLTQEAAQSLLALKFDRTTTSIIRRLLKKNNQGTISAPDRILLERHLRVGKLIDLLHAQARLALSKNKQPH